MLRGIYKYGLALCLCLTVSLLWAQKKTGVTGRGGIQTAPLL